MKIKIINECMLYGEVVKVGDVLDLDSVLATSAISFGNAQAYEEPAQTEPEPDDFDEDDEDDEPEPEPDDELADDAEPEASEDEEAAEAAVEEPELTEDPLTVALEETTVAAVASVNKTKKGSKK